MSQADNLAALATNVNSSGVLQPAGGGTGTSTSTGTGSVVLSNSPTLVTPTLGSASATQLATGLGSAAAPALTFTGDTNTGIFSPTADTIAFSEGGTESMRIDSSGNVGIGTSSPVTNSLTVTRAIGQGNLALLSSTAPTSNQRLFFIGAGSETDTGKARIGFETGEAWTAGVSTPTRMYFTTTPSGSTANAIRMLIDADGNVGIGTTSPTRKLHVSGADTWVSIQETTSGNTGQYLIGTGSVNALRFFDAAVGSERMRIDSSGNLIVGATSQIGSAKFGVQRSTAGECIRWTDGATGGVITTVASFGTNISSDALSFTTNSTERMRIDASGNVGIGVSPTVRLQVSGPDGNALLQINQTVNSNRLQIENNSAAYSYYHEGNIPVRFFTNATERMRIDGSGNLLIGRTSATGAMIDAFNGSSSSGVIRARNDVGGAQVFANFDYGGTVIGSITGNNSATAYNTSSDYRLKENIAPMIGALAAVAKLKPVTYDWKAGGSSQGFIAHELAEVVPDCVTGEKDAINEDGSILAQSIDTSFLVATLTAAIQEQQTLIENLTTRLNALEGK
jgi:hypothetical protein